MTKKKVRIEMEYGADYDTTITFKCTKGQKDFLKKYGKLYGMDSLTETIQTILNDDYVAIRNRGFTNSALHRRYEQELRDEEMGRDYDPLDHFDYIQAPMKTFLVEERPYSEWEFDNMIMWYEFEKEEAEKRGEKYEYPDPREDPSVLRRLDRNLEYYNY